MESCWDDYAVVSNSSSKVAIGFIVLSERPASSGQLTGRAGFGDDVRLSEEMYPMWLRNSAVVNPGWNVLEERVG